MAFPDTITVNGTLTKIDGTPEKGHIVFQSPISVLSSSDDTVVVPSYVIATLDVNGSFSIDLPASNDPNWNPNNWTYRVVEQLSSGKHEFRTIVPFDAPGGIYDYSLLVPAIDVDAQLYAPYNHTHAGGGGGSGVASVFGRTGVVVAQTGDYTKSQVGLGNVDNTSDLNKPISTATQTALNGKEATGVANSLVAAHEADTTSVHGIADTSVLATNSSVAAAIAAIDYPVDSVSGKTGTVTLVKGDVGLGNVDNTSDLNKPVSTATQTQLDLKAPLASPTFTGTVSGVSKSMVGLGNVDNTSDANKPVSTATSTALGLKVDKTDYPGLLVLNVGDPIPGGTATGTVIVRV